MRKLVYIVIFLVGIFTPIVAQNDPKAQEILDAMSKKYKDIPSFKASFTYTLDNKNAGVNETGEGEIVVKGGKFYLKLPQQEIYNNGTTVWTYMKESNEVNISAYEPDDDDINPTKIYTLYKKGYKYILMAEDPSEGGKAVDVIDMEPTDTKKKNQFYKIRIIINKKDKSIKSWKMFESNGNRYTYTIKTFTQEPVDDNFFVFDKNKYKGVHVEDLR